MSLMGYILFGLMMFVIFLYFNFPYQRVKAMLVNAFQSSVPAQLIIDTIEVKPPLSLAGRKVLVTADLNGKPIELLRADRVVLRFLPLSWIQGKRSLRLDVQAYGGMIYTMMNINNLINPINKPLEIVIQGVNLGRHTVLRAGVAKELGGLLEGEIKFHPRPGGLRESQLGGQLTASNVVIEGIRNLPVNPGRLTFSKIECVVALSDGILHVAPLRAKGPEVEGTLEGTLSLGDQLRTSIINMHGSVLIKPILAQKLGPILHMLRQSRGAAKEIPFLLTGTLDHPNLRLSRIKF